MGRQRTKPVVTVPTSPMGSATDAGFNAAAAAGGGIQAGAHPEYGATTPLETVERVAKNVAKAVRRAFSPSTVRARERR